MPLGWERLNTKKQPPNKNIVFIKPLPGAHEATSLDFLSRIAAQCLPIMNAHYLAVVSLEEYEPNLEFWGRNFNNGEVIQLVLRSPSTGRWLPFKFVQMVMMHELAHNKQMNHGPAFWSLRNVFAKEMHGLWEKGYTGDGLYGRGILLDSGKFDRDELGQGEILPDQLCGGTFASRGRRKRKAGRAAEPKPKVTYRERQERRIAKKFGTNGQALGADEDVKVKLEAVGPSRRGTAKKPTTTTLKSAPKPRVAKSARGRELRAAAALARFETKPKEEDMKSSPSTEAIAGGGKIKIKLGETSHNVVSLIDDDDDGANDSSTQSEDDADDDNEDAATADTPESIDDARERDGSRLLDPHGRPMVRTCEGQDATSSDAVKHELSELQNLWSVPAIQAIAKAGADDDPVDQQDQPEERRRPRSGDGTMRRDAEIDLVQQDGRPPVQRARDAPCPICTTMNQASTRVCNVCAHVLRLDIDADGDGEAGARPAKEACRQGTSSASAATSSSKSWWRCMSAECQRSGSRYVNDDQVKSCSACGAERQEGRS